MSCINRKTVFRPDSFPGYKAMSTEHMPLKGKSYDSGNQINRKTVFTPETFPGYGCISSAHGVVPPGRTKGLHHAEGRIGKRVNAPVSGTNVRGAQGPIGKGRKAYHGHKGK